MYVPTFFRTLKNCGNAQRHTHPVGAAPPGARPCVFRAKQYSSGAPHQWTRCCLASWRSRPFLQDRRGVWFDGRCRARSNLPGVLLRAVARCQTLYCNLLTLQTAAGFGPGEHREVPGEDACQGRGASRQWRRHQGGNPLIQRRAFDYRRGRAIVRGRGQGNGLGRWRSGYCSGGTDNRGGDGHVDRRDQEHHPSYEGSRQHQQGLNRDVDRRGRVVRSSALAVQTDHVDRCV